MMHSSLKMRDSTYNDSDGILPGSAAGGRVQPSGWHNTEKAAQNLEGQNTHPAMAREQEVTDEGCGSCNNLKFKYLFFDGDINSPVSSAELLRYSLDS